MEDLGEVGAGNDDPKSPNMWGNLAFICGDLNITLWSSFDSLMIITVVNCYFDVQETPRYHTDK